MCHSTEDKRRILINQLQQLEQDTVLKDNAHCVLSEDIELVSRICAKAKHLLLSDDEERTMLTFDQLYDAGFRVCARESGLFGWTSGVIFTRKGRIEF